VIPAGLCQCGCGQATGLAPQRMKALGYQAGEPYRFIRGHSTRLREQKTSPMRERECPFCTLRVKALARHCPPGAGWCKSTMPHSAAAERFWAMVEKAEGCWLWTGSDNKGYGQFSFRGRPIGAHVFAYELVVGPVPAGLVLDHLCRTPRCIRPDHLEPVTNEENLARGIRRNQFAGKEHCPAGHAYDEANTYRDQQGHRSCRACAAARARASRRRIAA
jgi:hypothetical protein